MLIVQDPLAVKVRIRNREGRYLTRGDSDSSFSDDPSRAIVFDYLRHHVAEQLEELRRTRGIFLEAMPVDPAEVYEICDLCREYISPFDTFFDGGRFFCFECLAKGSALASAQLPQPVAPFQAFSNNGAQ